MHAEGAWKICILLIAFVVLASGCISHSYSNGEKINNAYKDLTRVEKNTSISDHDRINESVDFCGISTYGACNSDNDCIRSGCSGKVCQSRSRHGIMTTCEFKECYDSKKYGYECKCVSGQCMWAKS